MRTSAGRRCPHDDLGLFVDETKAKGYVVVTCRLAGTDLRGAQQAMRALVLRGPLHMKKERESRRKEILSTIEQLAPEVTIYIAPAATRDKMARAMCLRAVVEDAAGRGPARIVVDLDVGLVRDDHQTLVGARREFRGSELHYEHATRNSELLLILPDALAWAWGRGGPWRQRVRRLGSVRQL